MVIISFYDNDVRHDCGIQGKYFHAFNYTVDVHEIFLGIMWLNNLIGIDRGYPGV